jgi:CobQ-like glutamine amidotransferase family enzyme
MIRLEVLYPEYMNLYGDRGNIRYLQECIPNLEIIYTELNDKPAFLKKKIDILYMGPTTENNQEEIAALLLPYKDKIKSLIDNGTIILAIGNALEYFGKYIEKLDGKRIKCLGLYNVYTNRIENLRHNENCLGMFNDITIVGFKNQMSHLYGKDKHKFLDMKVGSGRNKDVMVEGLMENNFIGTYLLGPILPLNPYLTKYLLDKLKLKNIELPFYDDGIKAYEKRIEEFTKK